MTSESIHIIGSGLVGAMLANVLGKEGYNITLSEKRADPTQNSGERGRSINLALSTRGWNALSHIGIADEVRQYALPMYSRMIHDITGKTYSQPYSQSGEAIYSVSRHLLNISLIKCLKRFENVNLEFEKKVVAVQLYDNTVKFSDDTTKKSDFLIGADGAFSTIRNAMTKTDRFSYSQQYLSHGYKELTIPPDSDGNFALDSNALHIWPRKRFMMIALPNPDHSFTATLFLDHELLKNDVLESKNQISFDHLKDEKSVADFFSQYFPDVVPLMPSLVDEFFKNPTSSLFTVQCSPWCKERALLIGDAAHAIVPFYGQGMNCGFEDCMVLLEILKKQKDITTAFEYFSINRKPDTDAISALALQNFIEMRDLVAEPHFQKKKKIDNKLHDILKQAWLPLYTMVTFSNLPYSQALAIGKKQNIILEELAALSSEALDKILSDEKLSDKILNRL